MVVRQEARAWFSPPAVAAADATGDLAVALSWQRRRILLLLSLVALAAASSALLATSADDIDGWLAGAGNAVAGLRWPFLLPVIALAAAHYCAAASGLRAAAGVPMRPRTTVAVQLAAAAANRVTVAGIGATAVNTRYLTRSGLPLPSALSSMAALGLFGTIAKTLALVTVVWAGSALGLGNGTAQLGLVGHHVVGMLGPLRSTWVVLPLALTVAAALVLALVRRLRGRRSRRWAQLRGSFAAPLAELLRHPRRIAVLMASCAATTVILGAAFVASAHVVAGVHPATSTAGLLVAYMLGGTVGTATPLPGGIGATEATLTAMLVADHVPPGQALQVVLLFRVVTFWLPAVIGLLASRRLVRRRVL